MDLREDWVTPEHKQCQGFVFVLIAVVNLVFTIPTSDEKCPLQKRTLSLYRTGHMKTVYPGILEENTTAYQSHWHRD